MKLAFNIRLFFLKFKIYFYNFSHTDQSRKNGADRICCDFISLIRYQKNNRPEDKKIATILTRGKNPIEKIYYANF